jgi:hypothetical protein
MSVSSPKTSGVQYADQRRFDAGTSMATLGFHILRRGLGERMEVMGVSEHLIIQALGIGFIVFRLMLLLMFMIVLVEKCGIAKETTAKHAHAVRPDRK